MQKKKSRRKEKICVGVIGYAIFLIYSMWPVYRLRDGYHSFYGVFRLLSQKGAAALTDSCRDVWDGNMGAIKIQVGLFVIMQIVAVLYLILLILNKYRYIQPVVIGIAITEMFLSDYAAYGTVADNVMAFMFFMPMVVMSLLELALQKMIDVYDEALARSRNYEVQEQEKKEEAHRRLDFPGKYTKLFYHMIWKNFRSDWKDYRLFLLCGIMVGTLAFSGLGAYEMLSSSHRADLSMYGGEGLGRILINAMIPLAACCLFLMVFVLIFYLRKWIQNYSIFVTLGIRRKALWTIAGLEIGLGFVFSYIGGVIVGNGVLLLFRKIVGNMVGDQINLSYASKTTYLVSLAVLFLVYLVSLMATRDIVSDFNLISAATRNVAKEKMPRRFLKIITVIGAAICGYSAISYSKIYNYEKITLMLALFVGLFLLYRFGGTLLLRKDKASKGYLGTLLKRNDRYHRSKTTAWYLAALTALHICGMFYFAFQSVSVTVAEQPESLFPYDFMCISYDEDQKTFENLEKQYGAKVTTYPMVRISNSDKTEKNEGYYEKRIQGQQIGISESTYHALKKAIDPDYKPHFLHLDAKGEKVYLVHQQDRSVKAQPIDWTFSKKKPNIHVGIVCEGYTPYEHFSEETTYQQRTIAGEEIGSLTGCFRDGKLENLVVFSDAFFTKAQNLWKTTNVLNGSFIKKKTDAIEGLTVKQGPTKLVLVNSKAKDHKAIKRELEKFQEKHKEDQAYDAEIANYYAKDESVKDLRTERMMKLIVNLFVTATMLFISMFLVYIKVLSELDEKNKRAEFFTCMGMRKKERIRILLGELHLMFWLPGAFTALVTAVFTGITFYVRMYTNAVKLQFITHAVWLWGGYILVELLFMWLLGKFMVRKVEKDDE